MAEKTCPNCQQLQNTDLKYCSFCYQAFEADPSTEVAAEASESEKKPSSEPAHTASPEDAAKKIPVKAIAAGLAVLALLIWGLLPSTRLKVAFSMSKSHINNGFPQRMSEFEQGFKACLAKEEGACRHVAQSFDGLQAEFGTFDGKTDSIANRFYHYGCKQGDEAACSASKCKSAQERWQGKCGAGADKAMAQAETEGLDFEALQAKLEPSVKQVQFAASVLHQTRKPNAKQLDNYLDKLDSHQRLVLDLVKKSEITGPMSYELTLGSAMGVKSMGEEACKALKDFQVLLADAAQAQRQCLLFLKRHVDAERMLIQKPKNDFEEKFKEWEPYPAQVPEPFKAEYYKMLENVEHYKVLMDHLQ